MVTDTQTNHLVDWVLRRATEAGRDDKLIESLCDKLLDSGLPLWRASFSIRTIDPTFSGISLVWYRQHGFSSSTAAHDCDGETTFRNSPIYALLTQNLESGRWRIEAGEGCQTFPLLAELRAQGGCDYLLHIVTFAPDMALVGAAIGIATDRAGGFSDDEVSFFRRLLPALGLAIYRLSLAKTLRQALSTYLGPMSGARVLTGQIVRGQGETVSAAILLADLRSFSSLADREDPLHVVHWLNEHFEALGEPVAAQGGEILKFLGDGFLAVFPVSDPAAHPCPVCDLALTAAELGLARNDALNARRRGNGLPELDVGFALHFGDVIYGNVGTPRRLDFTVIGRAVNEASRMEKLCGELSRQILLSNAFAQRSGRPLTALGSFDLRGLEGPRWIWTTA